VSATWFEEPNAGCFDGAAKSSRRYPGKGELAAGCRAVAEVKVDQGLVADASLLGQLFEVADGRLVLAQRLCPQGRQSPPNSLLLRISNRPVGPQTFLEHPQEHRDFPIVGWR
jgi:hypothetical protein